MTVRDEVAAFLAVRGPQCRVGLFLDGLDKPTRADLEAAMGDRALPHTAFTKWALTKHATKINGDTWSRHRNHECACGRS